MSRKRSASRIPRSEFETFIAELSRFVENDNRQLLNDATVYRQAPSLTEWEHTFWRYFRENASPEGRSRLAAAPVDRDLETRWDVLTYRNTLENAARPTRTLNYKRVNDWLINFILLTVLFMVWAMVFM